MAGMWTDHLSPYPGEVTMHNDNDFIFISYKKTKNWCEYTKKHDKTLL
jgi:hypothetical protein